MCVCLCAGVCVCLSVKFMPSFRFHRPRPLPHLFVSIGLPLIFAVIGNLPTVERTLLTLIRHKHSCAGVSWSVYLRHNFGGQSDLGWAWRKKKEKRERIGEWFGLKGLNSIPHKELLPYQIGLRKQDTHAHTPTKRNQLFCVLVIPPVRRLFVSATYTV